MSGSTMFDSVSGRAAFQRQRGLKRAALWRKLGFANLVKARAVLAAKRQREREAKRAAIYSPFAIRDDLPK